MNSIPTQGHNTVFFTRKASVYVITKCELRKVMAVTNVKSVRGESCLRLK